MECGIEQGNAAPSDQSHRANNDDREQERRHSEVLLSEHCIGELARLCLKLQR
jgi:hypothetical protein